jgi:hypothetical protein
MPRRSGWRQEVRRELGTHAKSTHQQILQDEQSEKQSPVSQKPEHDVAILESYTLAGCLPGATRSRRFPGFLPLT